MKRKNLSHLTINVQKEKDFYFEHEDFIAGVPPFLRGIHSTMYVEKPWVSKLEIAFSTPLASNLYLKKKIADGQKDITIIFQNPKTNDVIHSTSDADILILFHEIPLNTLSITLQISDDESLKMVSLFIETVSKLGFNKSEVTFSIVQLTSDFSEHSTLQRSNLILYCLENFKNFESFYLPTIQITCEKLAEDQLLHFLREGETILHSALNKGIAIDPFAPKLGFHWNISANNALELSKMRAMRMLWTRFIKQFNPKNAISSALKIHATTYNLNTTFTAAFGGCQSITGTIELLQFVAIETSITKTVDPWGGSHFIEEQTSVIANSVWSNFKK